MSDAPCELSGALIAPRDSTRFSLLAPNLDEAGESTFPFDPRGEKQSQMANQAQHPISWYQPGQVEMTWSLGRNSAGRDTIEYDGPRICIWNAQAQAYVAGEWQNAGAKHDYSNRCHEILNAWAGKRSDDIQWNGHSSLSSGKCSAMVWVRSVVASDGVLRLDVQQSPWKLRWVRS